MDRRTFLKGFCKATAIVSLGGLTIVQSACAIAPNFVSDAGVTSSGTGAAAGKPGALLHVTTSDVTPAEATGPLMADALEFVRETDGIFAYFQGMHVLTVDDLGFELIRRADGTRSIAAIANELSIGSSMEAVAMFFVDLGIAGWLQNTVLVALGQNAA
jgi:hypothetical protein